MLLLIPLLANSAQPAVSEGPDTTRVAHGCYIKAGFTANGKGNYGDPDEGVGDSAACARKCSEKERCNSFFFHQGICHFRNDLELVKEKREGYTAGWCPKGKSKYTLGELTFSSSPSPLRCTTTIGEFCQFPFVFNGNPHWDCIKNATGQPVCNVKGDDEAKVQVFSDLHSFVQCEKCEACSTVEADYQGFALEHETESVYTGVTHKEECKILCQLAENCNFYKFGVEDDDTFCILKDGLGKKHNIDDNSEYKVFVGPKLCSEECGAPFLKGAKCLVSCRVGAQGRALTQEFPATYVGEICSITAEKQSIATERATRGDCTKPLLRGGKCLVRCRIGGGEASPAGTQELLAAQVGHNCDGLKEDVETNMNTAVVFLAGVLSTLLIMVAVVCYLQREKDKMVQVATRRNSLYGLYFTPSGQRIDQGRVEVVDTNEHYRRT